MAKDEKGVQPVATAPVEAEPKGPKMVRCFYRKYKVKVILQSEEERQSKSKKEGGSATFRKCEAFIPEDRIALLKKDRRYGIDYLTLDDLKAQDDSGYDSFVEQMREACTQRKQKPPILPRR